jgi:hypothetical protein
VARVDFSMRRAWRALLSLPGLLLLAACGGQGTLVAGGGTGGTGISTGAITAVSSITVNGVNFDTGGADVRPEGTELREGKVVIVRGDFHADGLTGIALNIKVEKEVRARVSAKGSDTLTVLGQTVLVTRATVFANAEDFEEIRVDDPVEVHGFRNAEGTIVATRVELLGAGEVVDEVRGTITAKTGTESGTITIGGADFTFDAGTEIVIPPGAAFEVRALVEIRLDGGTFRANRIEVEDEQDPVFTPAEGERFEAEGFVSLYSPDSPTDPFLVGRHLVSLAANVRFKGGLPGDMGDGILVTAKGRFSEGELVADEIEFKDSIRIESNATAATATTVTLLGKVVHITSATDNRLENGLTGGIRVRGFPNLDGSITATRIENRDEVEPGRHILQGLVGEFDEAARTLVIIGITVNASGAEHFRDDDAELSAGEFFTALVASRTVVKARGTPVGDPVDSLIAKEVEIE